MLASSRSEKEKAVNVQVLLRCRPFSEDELRSNAPQVITCNEFQKEVAVSQTIAGKLIDRVFTFDKVFGPSAKQKDLYEQAITPIVNEVLEGFNCTIFAYGQTGTGKTYTMEGECRKAKNGRKGQLPLDAGVIPRAVKQIFDALECQHTEYSVKVTFLELYNEEITDLLAPEELSKIVLEEKQKKQLPLMEDGKGGVLVKGLEEEIVTSADEIFSLLERGSSKRRTAETLLNKQSSRSHSLFSITIHIKEATPEGEELIKCGKLNLVDLAGSENISRSGARDGRAREAGEINKSLLTLGRVITALVEHLGHIPYRDSKLTRLLRDSLGGRTKTCIIATVSPSVHCLEETLSTLDYAHRAKNIKNRPEVNQKMMKSTLIKDLYGEIERLKAEVYATREKVGVYIPKERYYQEEAERKAMIDQIEQMGVLLENNQKQIDDLQGKYDCQLLKSIDLSKKLEATERSLDHTSKLLGTAKEDLQHANYKLKEKDFVIAEQRNAENALAHQACVLRADLEKSIQDNALLFSKIAREDQLNYANRSLVDKFQADLAKRISTICSLLVSSIKRQNKHLQSVENLSKSCLDFHDKALIELEKKVSASRLMYASHTEGIQNTIRLHKATNNASLEELSNMASENSCSLDHLLALGGADANLIFTDLQGTLSNLRGEIAQFTRELRERFNTSSDHTNEISSFVFELLDELREKSNELQCHSIRVHDAQTQSINEFQKAYEEQIRSDAENLITQVTTLVSTQMNRQKALVDAKLNGLRDAALENKTFLDKHTSSVAVVTSDAKRKWKEFYVQTQNDLRDGSDFSSVKHCRLEAILQQCVNTADAASQQWEKVHDSAGEMSAKHVKDMEALVRNTMESNDQHDTEIDTLRLLVDEHAKKHSTEIINHFDAVLEYERESVSRVMEAVEAHSSCLQELTKDHTSMASNIDSCTRTTFEQDYMDYEPSGETPLRSEPDLPSKGMIESLRTMPMDALLEEFRENNPYESTKEPKPSLIPRSPLIQLN
ncbi:kinesin-like protein KIN-5C [Phalaenopsis equestris]|uniref:kinesin-like protein KIN-5C n=1 Tax=Phalaenopsis equestris TaxID=78828 RepID=UPI0009E5F46C|nr:kinesin-like protein KIN-5C [Phalaenopsis equestris]